MGYRSSVRIITSKKGYDELEKYVKREIKNQPKGTDNLLDFCDIKTIGKNACSFGWEDIKWYENTFGGYEDILTLEKGLDYLEEKNMSYRFARIGESYDDYEEKINDGSDDIDLPYPNFERFFDDNYVEKYLGEIVSKTENNKLSFEALQTSLINSLNFIEEECHQKKEFINLAHNFGLNKGQLESLGFNLESEEMNEITY